MKFIDGIKLLNAKEITKEKDTANLWWFISIIWVGLAVPLLMIYSDIILFTIATLISVYCLIISLSKMNKTSTKKFQYQVSVDDTVGYNDFMKNYNLISRDGEIFTIELRNDKEENENAIY